MTPEQIDANTARKKAGVGRTVRRSPAHGRGEAEKAWARMLALRDLIPEIQAFSRLAMRTGRPS